MVKEAVTTGELRAEKSPENAVEFKRLKEELGEGLREEVKTEIKKSLDEVVKKVEKKVSFVIPYETIKENAALDYKINDLTKKQDDLTKAFDEFKKENKKDFESLRKENKEDFANLRKENKEDFKEMGNKLDKNTKWTIGLIISMVIGFLGVIVAMINFSSNLARIISG